MRLSGQKALKLFTGEEQRTTLNGVVVNDATGPKLRTSRGWCAHRLKESTPPQNTCSQKVEREKHGPR